MKKGFAPRNVLITRPQRDAEALAVRLTHLGFSPVICPLLAIHQRPEALKMWLDAAQHMPQAIVLTSRHAADSLKGQEALHDLTVIAVGEATAQAARDAGYTNVYACEGNVAALLKTIPRYCPNMDKPVLYLRGEDVHASLKELVPEYHIEEIIAYRAVAARRMPAAVHQMLGDGAVQFAMFFSRRTAEIYTALAYKDGLEDVHKSMQALVLSNAVAEGLAALCWQHVHIPPVATAEAMEILLANLCS